MLFIKGNEGKNCKNNGVERSYYKLQQYKKVTGSLFCKWTYWVA